MSTEVPLLLFIYLNEMRLYALWFCDIGSIVQFNQVILQRDFVLTMISKNKATI